MFSASVALIAPAVGVGLGAGLAETVEALGAGVGADVEPVEWQPTVRAATAIAATMMR